MKPRVSQERKQRRERREEEEGNANDERQNAWDLGRMTNILEQV